MKIIDLECTNSTNEYCKALNADEDTAVFAKRQTGGKGTKGRFFYSEEGGIYLSLLRRYENFPAGDAFKIMINCSVAVCKTVEDFGVKPHIKWANDVLVGNKKICGTLIENTVCGGKIIRSIVGMGLNVNNPLAPEIRDIATSLSLELNKKLDLERVKDRFLCRLEGQYSLKDYKSYIDWLGSEILLVDGDKTRKAVAVDICENGSLKVNWSGDMLEITAGEVSLRL